MDDRGLMPSFKIVWCMATAIFYMVGCYMIFKHENSTGLVVARWTGRGSSRTITGEGVLFIAVLFSIIGLLMFWPFKKKAND